MSHQRQLIREAAKAKLLAASIVAGSRVYPTRMVPWREVELPAIAIYTLEESVDVEASKGTAPRYLYRNMKLEIVGTLRSGQTSDDDLDNFAKQIEKAIHADETLAGTCGIAILESTDIGILADGDKLMGQVSLVYAVHYETSAPDADDQALDAFESADVKYNLNNSLAVADQAEDTITGLGE